MNWTNRRTVIVVAIVATGVLACAVGSVLVIFLLRSGLLGSRPGSGAAAPTKIVYIDLATAISPSSDEKDDGEADDPSVTVSPEPTIIATATAQPTATPTSTPTDTPSPTPTPTVTPVVCTTPPGAAYAALWQRNKDELGCATSGVNSNVTIAQEHFERGMMTWHKNTDLIVVHYRNGVWNTYTNAWREGDPVFTCGTHQSPPTPLRGFGKVWCTHNVVREGLGNATGAEVGQTGRQQTFERGMILQSQYGDIYVFLDSGVWWVE